MIYKYNNKSLKRHRRDLRKNLTEHERILWSKLKKHQLQNLRFLKQYSVGSYIVDFYCPKLRLAIELDGSQHLEQTAMEYDKQRTKYLESENIRVLRYHNKDVTGNLDGVLENICEEINSLQK